jgi:Holliday junction resolvase-like predicted endonuclease
LPRLPTELRDVLVGAGLALAAVFAFRLLLLPRWRAWRQVRASRARARRAARGERDAERLLERQGYRIEARQLPTEYRLVVGGEVETVRLKVDLIVRRGGRRFLAEVKTGQRAPRIDHAETRRQLLEYATIYEVDGVLLVDMEAGEVREVFFPRPPTRRGRLAPFVLGYALDTAAAVLWLGR